MSSSHATPTPSIKNEYKPENYYEPSVNTENGGGYTHNIEHVNTNEKPIENVQIMPGWDNKHQLTAEDVPRVMDAVYKELAHRFRNMLDSSDEVGLS